MVDESWVVSCGWREVRRDSVTANGSSSIVSFGLLVSSISFSSTHSSESSEGRASAAGSICETFHKSFGIKLNKELYSEQRRERLKSIHLVPSTFVSFVYFYSNQPEESARGLESLSEHEDPLEQE